MRRTERGAGGEVALAGPAGNNIIGTPKHAHSEPDAQGLVDAVIAAAATRFDLPGMGIAHDTATLTDRSGGVSLCDPEFELAAVACFVIELRQARARAVRERAVHARRALVHLVGARHG